MTIIIRMKMAVKSSDDDEDYGGNEECADDGDDSDNDNEDDDGNNANKKYNWTNLSGVVQLCPMKYVGWAWWWS